MTEVNWFLYVVHLGTRFTRSSRDAIVEDLRVEQVEAAAYCNPLHLQRHYFELGYRRGDYFVTEKGGGSRGRAAVPHPSHAKIRSPSSSRP